MSGLRAGRAGSARDAQNKIDAAFDPNEAKKCLYWIQEMVGQKIPIEESEERYKVMENFYKLLKDGQILCRLIYNVLPDHMKFSLNGKTFQPAKNLAFEAARERDRIELFILKAQEMGVEPESMFQVDCLYEKTNLNQVCASIRALGTVVEHQRGYQGRCWWPKKAETNLRNFSEEQLRAGEAVISLQYGTNKGASQAGMNFGKKRMILHKE